MLKYSLIILSMSLASCSVAQQSISWSVGARLPDDKTGKSHIGLAGPIAGLLGDKLLIAGGANFPNGFPWDGGMKNYQKQLFIYDIKDEQNLVLENTSVFEDSIAYAANYSDGNILYSVGGERNGKAIADSYTYELVNNEVKRRGFANLPISLTNGSLLKHGENMFFIGGENADLVSDKIYKFSNSKNSWEEYFTLPYPVSNSVCVFDDKKNIIIAGGRKKNTNSTSDIYDALLSIDTKNKKIVKVCNLPFAVAAGVGTYHQGKFILIGGDDASTFHKVESLIGKINLSEEGETKQKLINDKNTLQRNHPGFRKDVWSYDFRTNRWQQLNSLPYDSPVTTTLVKNDDMIIIPSGEIKAGVRTNQILVGKIK